MTLGVIAFCFLLALIVWVMISVMREFERRDVWEMNLEERQRRADARMRVLEAWRKVEGGRRTNASD